MSHNAQAATEGVRQAAGLSAEGGPASETAAVDEQAHRVGTARGADGVPPFTPRRRPPGPVGGSPGNSSPRRVVDRDGARKADLAAIHIGKKALAWDDDFYRDMLHTLCRVRSSADLDFAGRKRVLAHMQACGWNGGPQRHPGPAGRAVAARAPLSWEQRKVWSLWQQLADAGAVQSRKTPALMAWVQRQVGIDRLEWLAGNQAELAIESLKLWLDRVEREQA